MVKVFQSLSGVVLEYLPEYILCVRFSLLELNVTFFISYEGYSFTFPYIDGMFIFLLFFFICFSFKVKC